MRTVNFTTSYESLISRLPGLFAYVENDDKGVSILHKATDSPMGCYGKIVENILLPNNVEFVINDETILEKSAVYTYKTLSKVYYDYIEENPVEFQSFKAFFEKGIGRVEVKYTGLNPSKNDLVPEFVYLVTVQQIYNELRDLQLICNFYRNHKENKIEDDIETESQLCCKCELYERKGGDNFLEFLSDLIGEANSVANEYYEYAYNASITENQPLTINYSINLFSSDRDMGLVTPIRTNLADGQDVLEFSGTTDSKLKSLRRYVNYLDIYDNQQTPGYGKDWLFYYRVGDVRNISTLNDDFGNILCYNGSSKPLTKDEKVIDLYAFGDVITKIEQNTSDNSITFTYKMDTHLIATPNGTKLDDDGNLKCYYKDFEVDDNSFANVGQMHGITYTETYYYDPNDEDWQEFNNGLDFDKYVNGEYDRTTAVEQTIKQNDKFIKKFILKEYEKFEFDTFSNERICETNITNQKRQYTTNLSEFETSTIRDLDFKELNGAFIRTEFYSGVSYTPTENVDVNIGRGVTSIFDRHIRFSEVNTLKSMEEYSNGSFFVMQE